MSERLDEAITRRRTDGPDRSDRPEATYPGLTVASDTGADPVPLPRCTSLDRYLVLGPLGEGGMGTVYGAYDPSLRRRVALKVLRADRTVGGKPNARLLREARAMARLSHPNVLPVFDVGICEGRVFIAMEQVTGQTLRAWLSTERPWPEVLAAFRRAGEGLAAAHAQDLVHRDFKPDNVMIDQTGRVLVLDFGLVAPWSAPVSKPESSAALAGPADDQATRLTREGRAIGTPIYMAPEQHEGRAVDGRADQYALCVALFHALHGHWPFAGATLGALIDHKRRGPARVSRSRIPRDIDRILDRGLAWSPDDRWPSMRALLTALDQGIRARRRRRWSAGAAALGAVLAGLWAWRPTPACDRITLALPPDAAAHLHEHATRWRQQARSACAAEHAPALAERIDWCLDEIRTELLTAAELGPPVELRPPSVCEHASGLLAWAQPPPRERAPVLALRARLVRARATGASASALESLVEQARTTGDRRLLAEAQLTRARALPPSEVAAGFGATATAMEANDVESIARGWLVALEHMSADPQRQDEALGWLSVAEATVERAGADARLLARLALAFEGPLRAAGRDDRARALLGRARRHPGAAGLDPTLRGRLDAALEP